MSNIKISVALTTYNGEKFLKAQMDSLVNQYRTPDEIVICDDGSTDKTVEILRYYQREYPICINIYHNKKNLGVDKNFERALSSCSGDIIFLSDQDDVWFPEKISKVIKVFDEHPKIQLIVNDQINTDENLVHQNTSRLELRRALGYRDDTYATGCCMAIRKEWLKFLLPISIKGFDIWINRFSHLSNTRKLLEEPLQFYRRHDNNVSPGIGAEHKYPDGNISHRRISRDHDKWIELWEREIEYGHIYADRLDFLAIQAPYYAIPAKSSSIKLRRKIAILKERLEIIERSPGMRIVPICRMVLQGKYRDFHGFRSAIFDVFR